jgi:RHS repeat-associated protein
MREIGGFARRCHAANRLSHDAQRGVFVVAMTLAMLVVLGLFGPTKASAESICTDSWVGANNGSWQTGSNWSNSAAPTSSDVACIPSGKTVNLTAGTNQAAVVQGAGGLSISGGSLEVASTLEPSSLASLTLAGGTLSVAGELTVSSSISITGNPVTVSGAGKLIVGSGATGSIGSTSCSVHPVFSGVTFVNQGTLTFGGSAGVGAGAIALQSGAQFKNEGTFTDRSYDNSCGYGIGGNNWSFYVPTGTASITNTGTFQAEAGSQTLNVNAPFNNQGIAKTLSGTLKFTAGGSDTKGTDSASTGATLAFGAGTFTLSEDTWSGAGAVTVAGGSVTASALASTATGAGVSSGTLTVPEGATATASSLTLAGGTLSVAGELTVSSSISITGNPVTVSGAGKLIVGSGATGSIGSTSCSVHPVFSGVTFVNQGTLTFGGSAGVGAGAIALQSGAQFKNEGTFTDRSYDNSCGYGIGGNNWSFYVPTGTASITNTGTFQAEAGSQTLNVNAPFNNLGQVKSLSGTLRFTAGGIASQVATGSWKAAGGSNLVLGGGEFLIGEVVNLSEVKVEGATVKRVAVTGGPTGFLNPQPNAAGTVMISGSGESIGSGFSAASVESTPYGANEWGPLCGPLTPGLSGTFECAWNTASGSYPDGRYQLRGQLSDSSSPPNSAATKPITVRVDNTPPSGSVSTPSDLHGPQTISGTATDAGTGVASWQLQIAPEGSSEWANACPAQTSPVSGSTYQCTVEGFSYPDGAYKLRALITDSISNASTTTPASTTVDNVAPSNTAAPSVSGRAWVNQLLKSSSGEWSGTLPLSYAYQWQSCNSSGASCTNITGATSQNYAVKTSDIGHTLRVTVTASNPLGEASSSSSATSVVVESSCTDNWTGSSGGSWQTAGNWSAGVPGTSDVACIGSGITVNLSAGTNQTGTLWSQGAIALSGGSLEVANGLEKSNTGTLTLTGGTLTLAGELDVTSSLSSKGQPTLSGAGSLVISSGATGVFTGSCSKPTLDGATLVNQGTVTFGTAGGVADGPIWMKNGAQLKNEGTFNDDSYDNGCGYGTAGYSFYNAGGAAPSIVNTGTFHANGGAEPIKVGLPVSNQGTVDAQAGTLQLTGGSGTKGTWSASSGATLALISGSFSMTEGEWSGAGTLNLTGASVTTSGLQSSVAKVGLSSGSINVEGEPSTLTSGALAISGQPTIGGTGHLVIGSGATGTITGSCSKPTLDGATLVNQGTVTFGTAGGVADGPIWMKNGAQLKNEGTFNDDSYDNGCGYGTAGYSFYNAGGAAPSIVNTGTFHANGGAEPIKVGLPVSNQGTVDAQAGTLQLTGGSGTKGTWSASSGATLALISGSFSMTEGEWSGAGTLSFAGATVTAAELQSTIAKVSLATGALDVTASAKVTATSGTLAISGQPTIGGTGELVIGTGATTTIASSCSKPTLDGATLVNQGTVTFGASGGVADGPIWMKNGARFKNEGMFNDDTYDNGCGYGTAGYSFYNAGGAEPSIINTGTFQSAGGTEPIKVGVSFTNQGTATAKTGTMQFSAGGGGNGEWTAVPPATLALSAGSFSFTGGSWSGAVNLTGAAVSASKLEATSATVGLSSGSLTIPESSTVPIGSLTVTGSPLTATGELDITSSLSLSGTTTINGAGNLVVKPGATATVTGSCSRPILDGVTLVNQGTITSGTAGGAADGPIWMKNGAQLKNEGTFNDDSYDNGCGYSTAGYSFYNAGGTAPAIVNTGTFQANGGSEPIKVGVPFNNRGTVLAQAGKLQFAGGGVEGQASTGAWEASPGASVALTGGTFLLAEGKEFDAAVEGATVIWVRETLRGSLLPRQNAKGVTAIEGLGEQGPNGPFSSATVEATPHESNEWSALCSNITPGLAGEFSCSWNSASGSYPDGLYDLRAKLSSTYSPPEVGYTPTMLVLVDNTAPAGSMTAAPTSYVGGSPTITGTATDGGSGVRSWAAQIAPEGSSEWSSACASQAVPIHGSTYGCTIDTSGMAAGSYQVRAEIEDWVGNVALTSPVTLSIQNTAAEGTVSVAPFIGGTTILSGTAIASPGTVESWAVQAAPAGSSAWSSACPVQTTPVSGSEYACSMNTTSFGDGEYQLRAIVTDTAGNTYTTPSTTTDIDNTEPTGLLYSLPADVAGEIEFQGRAYDDSSGISKYTVQYAAAGSETFHTACSSELSEAWAPLNCKFETGLLSPGSYQFRAVIVDGVGNTYTTPVVTSTVASVELTLVTGPTISGEPFAGEALHASTGTWSGDGIISYTYQWQRCNASGEACADIEGETGKSYILGAADVGSTVKVVVSANTQPAESAPSAVIQANTLANASLPTIAGNVQQGNMLSADPGDWHGKQPISYAYQWQSCNSSGGECANITGATKQSYVPGPADIAKKLRVVVTASNEEGSSSATSAASSAVGAGSGSGIRYLYDEAGQLQIVDDPSQGAAVYHWDADGNLTSIQRHSNTTVSVLAVTPSHAPPGARVDITGTGYSSNTAEDNVTFNGVAGTVDEASTTDLIVTVPEGASEGLIEVTVEGESASAPKSFTPRSVLSHKGLATPPVVSLASITPAQIVPAGTSQASRASSKSTTPQGRGRGAPRACHSHMARGKSSKRTSQGKNCKTRLHGKSAHKRHHAGRHAKRRTKAPVRVPKRGAGASVAIGVPPAPAPQPSLAQLKAYNPPYPPAWKPTDANHRQGDWVTGRRPSPWAALAPLTPATATRTADGAATTSSPSSATSLAGQALVIDGTPLANVTLTIQSTGASAKTDNTGRFLLDRLPAGHQVLIIDGGTANGHGHRYGQFSVGVDLLEHKANTLGYTIWMTPLDPAGDRSIASPLRHEATLTNPRIPGLEVHLPAGTVIHDANGQVVTHLNMTAIPVDRPPFPLPFVTGIPTYFTVQPGRSYLSKGAQIVYPNWGHLPPRQRVDFWNYDPADRGWYIYGHGSVSTDGKQVIPDPDVRVWEFTGAMISSSNEPPGGPLDGSNENEGDPVDLATGLFVYQHTDLSLPDSEMPVALTRSYRPGDNNSYSFGVGTESPFDLHLWSNENYKTASLVLPDGSGIKFKRISSGTGWTDAVYTATETPSAWKAAVLQWNTGPGGWVLRRRDGMKFYFPDFDPVSKIEDRNGNSITIKREGAAGPVTELRTPHGRYMTLKHDAYNRITEAVDNAGQKVLYEYDSSGRLVKATDPMGRVTEYTYNSSNEMTKMIDPRGNTLIENFYSETKPQVEKQVVGGQGTYSFAYSTEESGKVARTEATDPDGRKRIFRSDAVTHAPIGEDQEGVEVLFKTSKAGEVEEISGTAGTAAFDYDKSGDGNIASVRLEPGSVSPISTRFTYNEAFSEPTSAVDPLGNTTSYSYDANGNLLGLTDPMGRKVSNGYDESGELTSVTNAAGQTTTFDYSNGDLVGATDPLGHKTIFGHNAAGDVTSIRDPEGRLTKLSYDNDDELTSATDPAGQITTYQYDVDGDLTSVTDPRGHTQTSSYDTRDQLTAQTDALHRTTRYRYDPAGLLASVTDPKGQTTNYSYGRLGRVSSVAFGADGQSAPTSTITYGYDAHGDVTSVVDSRNGTYKLGYDAFDRLTEVSGPNGTVGYNYNADGQRQAMTLNGEQAVSYGYDADGRLTGIETPNGNVSLTYDRAGRQTRAVLPDGDSENYTYNAASQLVGIVYRDPAGEAIGDLQYARDALGRVATTSGSMARTGLPTELTEASYNSANELTSLEGKSLTYDSNGNLTSDGTSTYTWNDRDQLTGIAQGTNSWSFTYDPFGRRASKTLNGSQTGYLYDGQNAAAELSGETITARMLNGFGLDERYARTTGAGTVSYLTNDQQSTIALANSSGTPATEYTYDPFGATTSSGASSTNPYQYTGRENDGTGLQYNRARYYSPAAARFVSEDPLRMEGSGVDLYAYATGDPVNFIDPTGYLSWEDVGEAITGAGDSLTGGLTGVARKALGIPEPDTSSAAYQIGANGGMAAAILIPGDEEAAAADEAAAVAKEAGEAGEATAPVGRRGEPIDIENGTNKPTEINGREFSGHAVDRMQGNGITPSAVEDAISHPSSTRTGNQPGTTVYEGSNGVVAVVNDNGRVITVRHD